MGQAEPQNLAALLTDPSAVRRGEGEHAFPLVSIIILNYNGADLLPACLDSLRDLAYPRYEVIVVENGSTDNSLQVLAGYPWVKVVRTEKNLGSTGGYNFGLPHSQGEFVLMMNNDMIANREFVSVLSEYLVAHPEVGIVQGKMILPRSKGALEVCGSFLTRYGFPITTVITSPTAPDISAVFRCLPAKAPA